MFSFGSGVLLGQRTDVANATGINFGLVQEVSTDLSFDLKSLYGQYQFPVALARGKAKFSAKAKMARISGIALGSLFFGVTPIVGELLTSFGEGPTAIPTTPFQITVTHGASFVDDYGVVNSATGLPFTRVANSPVAGQYSVAAGGVYTFASAENVSAISVLISYTYTVTTAGTQQINVVNQLMGNTPTFQAQLYTTFQGVPLNMKLFNCVSSKISMATKLDDFMIPEMDFEIFANAAGNVANVSFGEAA
jgi:hypothetical protein